MKVEPRLLSMIREAQELTNRAATITGFVHAHVAAEYGLTEYDSIDPNSGEIVKGERPTRPGQPPIALYETKKVDREPGEA